MSASVAGVIVAGGRAVRMGGRDKAFAAVGGEPIAVRTIRLFHELFPQVLVATNRPERFRGLGVETVADRFPGSGPLAGLHAALLATRHPHVFVAACDMPGLDPGVIRFLLARIGAADAVVPRWEGDVEPLHAIYAAHCLPAMEASLRAGRYALRDFLGTIRVDYVGEAELRRLRGAAGALPTAHTPADPPAAGGRLRGPAARPAPPAAPRDLRPRLQPPGRALRPPALPPQGRVPGPLGRRRGRRARGGRVVRRGGAARGTRGARRRPRAGAALPAALRGRAHRRARHGLPRAPRRPLPPPARGDRARRVPRPGRGRGAGRAGAILPRRPGRPGRVPPPLARQARLGV